MQPMKQLLLILLASATTVACATADDLAAENALLKSQIAKLKEGCSCESDAFSITGNVKRAAGITADVTSHILAQTDLDDHLVHHASKHYENAKAFTSDAAKKVVSVDYAGAVQDLASHPFYVDNVAPHVEKVSKAAKPYVEQYVNPALEKAGEHLGPAMKTAKETVAKAHKTIQEDVVPGISRAGSKAFEHVSDTSKHIDTAHSVLDKVVSPVFDAVHKASPEKAKELPRHPLDRFLLIIVILFILYHTSWIFARFFKFSFSLTKFCVKVTSWLTYLFVLLPIKTILRVLNFFLWIFTFFGCCGLCCRSKSKKNGDATKEPATSKKNGAAATVTDVTVADLQSLLDKAKKEDKLMTCAKQLVEGAKTGKAIEKGPPKLKGKKVPKDVLKQTLSKYKELDLKKLGI